MSNTNNRRTFLLGTGLSAAALGLVSKVHASDDEPKIQGFEDRGTAPATEKQWEPISDRTIRMGIVGYGVCKFGAQFSLQNHPNVDVVAVSDLFPDRCSELAKVCRCSKTYPSLEEMVKDESIEAIFLATDAPSHCRHAMEVLKHGKHVAVAVPAVFGSLEDADRLLAAVKVSGLNYMMFETSCYHDDLYAMRQVYRAGGFGKLLYSEGEYFHYSVTSIDSYKKWRVGLPPQWYPTHSNAYYIGVTDGSFIEVSCMGMPSILEHLNPQNNVYQNPFGTEIAMFRTNEGGMARMAVSWDNPGFGGEVGRTRGQKGSMVGTQYDGLATSLPDLTKPALPPSVEAGGHGGSHGQLGHEFVMSILEERVPSIDVAKSLNMTVAGIVAHQSALKDGELMKVPQYKL